MTQNVSNMCLALFLDASDQFLYVSGHTSGLNIESLKYVKISNF